MWKPKSGPTYLHYDCMSFIELNGYPTTCLDLVKNVVYVMSARAQSNKLPRLLQVNFPHSLNSLSILKNVAKIRSFEFTHDRLRRGPQPQSKYSLLNLIMILT
jgi:hypothetical protein